jgi:hypothetical protein
MLHAQLHAGTFGRVLWLVIVWQSAEMHLCACCLTQGCCAIVCIGSFMFGFTRCTAHVHDIINRLAVAASVNACATHACAESALVNSCCLNSNLHGARCITWELPASLSQ